MTTCNTCCRDVRSPFRSFNQAEKIVSGCVSAAHDGQLVAPSASSFWHNRPESKKLRAVERNAGMRVTS